MSVVRINAITVPAAMAEVLEQRFAERAGEVATSPGFEAFELLRPTDGRDVYYVYTRWATQEGHNTDGPVSNASELLAFDVVQHEGPAV